MKLKRLKVNFKDKRGSISDIFYNNNIEHVAIIKSKPNVLRGNHFHKKTIQWNYLLSGKIIIYAKKKGQGIKKKILNKGDLVVTLKNESHAIKALKNSEFLVFTQGPRGGKEYETDTFRLKKPLV